MLKLPKPDDFHVHVRQGEVLSSYVKTLAAQFRRAIIMPNTLPPVKTAEDVLAYRSLIVAAAREVDPAFEALMTFKIAPPPGFDGAASESDTLAWAGNYVRGLKAAGVKAGKLYPQGVTTNSSDGVKEINELFPLFSAMEDQGVILCVHGEAPEAFCLDRERSFLPQLDNILKNFPRLKLVLEHVSTRDAAEWVERQDSRVAATITAHHLLYTLDDLLGDHLNPHLFCKPLLKFPKDRTALQRVVLEGNPRFFFGSDSAPHAKENKECACGAAGVYSAPVALPVLAQFFEDAGKLGRLQAFCSEFGARFYGLPLTADTVELVREDWTVPPLVDGVVPMAAGQTLRWKLADGAVTI